MIELEDVDLAKALSVVGQRCVRLARDLTIEVAPDPAWTHDLADKLEDAARQLRDHAAASPPKVIDVTQSVESPSPVDSAIPRKGPSTMNDVASRYRFAKSVGLSTLAAKLTDTTVEIIADGFHPGRARALATMLEEAARRLRDAADQTTQAPVL